MKDDDNNDSAQNKTGLYNIFRQLRIAIKADISDLKVSAVYIQDLICNPVCLIKCIKDSNELK